MTFLTYIHAFCKKNVTISFVLWIFRWRMCKINIIMDSYVQRRSLELRNKRTLIIGMAAALIVLVGIFLALLLSPVSSFLFGGSGEDFRTAGACSPRKVAEDSEPEVTDDFSIEIVENTATPAPSPTDEAPNTQTPEPTVTPIPEPTATPLPIEQLYEMADTSMMQDIVNILLVGVDYSEERMTWNGKKEWHSDVMMVLSVNFDENRADLISLPRDTYAKIPGVDGIYKLNASINCGGGLYKDDGTFNPAGLEKVCEAAEWMLGGIPVDYYYCVTMTSLKSLVDAFGGLDYDLDVSFRIQGRSYVKGLQHMDGQAVLDYCRVRKAGNGLPSNEQGDANRVNRQKRILVAFFEHMKKNNMITKIPDVIKAFQGELFTNCTLSQTSALALFAYNLDKENIGMYSMGGTQASLFQWNFVFTDQANRVDIIQKVYGVAATQYRQYTLKYGRYRWCSMLYDQYIDLCEPLRKYVQALIDEDDLLPEYTATPESTETPGPSEEPTPETTQTPTVEPTKEPTPNPTALPTKEPTQAPTERPTEEPTEKPTEEPTEKPTEEPTEKPTEVPTEVPTQAPTIAPTEQPTEKPTEEPTEEPTEKPTENPTEAPTEAPTLAPTDTPKPEPETISIKVEINWNDKSDKDGVRPNEVGIVLKANGSAVERKAIKEKDGNWKTTFSEMPKEEDGSAIEYTVSLDKDHQTYSTLKQYYDSEIKGSASKGFTIKLTHEVKADPTEVPQEPDPGDGDTNTSRGSRILWEEIRKYTPEQRALFEEFKTALDELKDIKKYADSEAKKSSKGSGNSLNTVSINYINQLEKVQNLAIQVAKEFGYTKVSNFTNSFLPRETGWRSNSPWAVNYGLNRSFNEVRVDFN